MSTIGITVRERTKTTAADDLLQGVTYRWLTVSGKWISIEDYIESLQGKYASGLIKDTWHEHKGELWGDENPTVFWTDGSGDW